MAPIIGISSLKNDEEAYRRKFNNQLKKSNILIKSFVVACAVCRTLMKSHEVNDGNCHSELHVLLCHICAERVGASGKNMPFCNWCGKDLIPRKSKVQACKMIHCNRKFCEDCVHKLQDVAKEKNCKGKCFCVFCEPRLIWEDRAICCAVFQGVDEEDPIMEKKHKTFVEQECIICSDSAAQISFIPCGHTCLCTTCLPKFEEKFVICPICQEKYEESIIAD